MESQTGINDSQRQLRHRRVILFPFPYQGHINPMLQLANLLYSKGFSITILHTNFNSPKTSNYPHFTFKSILDNDSKDGQRSSIGKELGVSQFLMLSQRFEDEFRKEMELLLASEKDERVSCLITDSIWHFTQPVADSIKLPRLVLRISSLFAILVIAALPLLNARGYFESSNTHLEEEVVEFPVLQVKDLQKFATRMTNDPHVTELFANIIKQTRSSSGIITNSFKDLEEAELEILVRDFQIPSFMFPLPKYFTGSLSSLLEQDDTFLPWLDQQPPNSVLYVSFGSTSKLDEKDFMEIAHGLLDSKLSFIWVVRPDFIKGSTGIKPLPDGFFGENGRIVKWAPQHKVLAHKATGAFWTHCGWNSAVESICEGVPMICTPFHIDQPLTAKYMSVVWKIVVYLENGLQREEISSVVRRVMADEEMRARAKALKEKVDASVIKGGSSYESLESLVNYISSF